MITAAPLPSKEPEPLKEEDFAGLMEACGPWAEENPQFAVAVSGGPDSTALLFLLHEWAQKRGGQAVGLIVDHRLREDSRTEAVTTGRLLAQHGIPHAILPWMHKTPPQSAIHASARRARYDLLLDTCRIHKFSYLFLAHHADDQAETLLMRLSRATGIDGLAGMAAQREQDGITIVRPLLPIRKMRLEATCRARAIPFLRDPSNNWERFTRTRLRGMQQSLSRAGLTVDRLNEIAREAGAARAHLEATVNDWLKAHATVNLYGAASLCYPSWRALNDLVRLKVLTRVLLAVGGSEYPPRSASLERMAANLMKGEPLHQTLSGCHIQHLRDSMLFTREEGVLEEETPLAHFTPHRRWDNRFVFSISPDFDTEDFTVRALGTTSRNVLLKKGAERIAQLPAAMRGGLPGIFRDSSLYMVPELTAEIPAIPAQAPVTSVFSPRHGFLVKPFRPASFIMPA